MNHFDVIRSCRCAAAVFVIYLVSPNIVDAEDSAAASPPSAVNPLSLDPQGAPPPPPPPRGDHFDRDRDGERNKDSRRGGQFRDRDDDRRDDGRREDGRRDGDRRRREGGFPGASDIDWQNVPPLPFDTSDFRAIQRWAKKLEALHDEVDDGRRALRREARLKEMEGTSDASDAAATAKSDELRRQLHRRALELGERDRELRLMLVQTFRQSDELAETIRAAIDSDSIQDEASLKHAEKMLDRLERAKRRFADRGGNRPPGGGPPMGAPQAGMPPGMQPGHPPGPPQGFPHDGEGAMPPGGMMTRPGMPPNHEMHPGGPPMDRWQGDRPDNGEWANSRPPQPRHDRSPNAEPGGRPGEFGGGPFRSRPGFRGAGTSSADGEPMIPDVQADPGSTREIDALREENKRQRRRIEELEKRLEKMEALILGLQEDD